MSKDIKLEKEITRRKFNLIRHANSSLIHEKIKLNVIIALHILIKRYQGDGKYIGIYWPLKGEVDLTFLKDLENQKIALPSSSKTNGMKYHKWSKSNLEPDSNGIPAPIGEQAIPPAEISMLLVPAIAIDKAGFRLGYGGGYFDRLRQKEMWSSLPAFVVISHNCISKIPLPRDEWDLPFSGWISEKGLHQIEATK